MLCETGSLTWLGSLQKDDAKNLELCEPRRLIKGFT